MDTKKTSQAPFIIEPHYFSNWVDQFMPKIANSLIPLVAPFDFITPNLLTLVSYGFHVIACVLLFTDLPYHLYIAAFLFPASYILDCMDGQLARTKKLSSLIGNYLDKTLDVLKIYQINLALSLAVYFQTGNVLWIIAGFTSCFFFMFRYYIKLETVYSGFADDPEYLKKSKAIRLDLYEKYQKMHTDLRKTAGGWLKSLWLKNRIIFFLDEGEFIFLTAIAALFNRLDIALLLFTVINIIVGLFRLGERGYQTHTQSKRLLLPMRK